MVALKWILPSTEDALNNSLPVIHTRGKDSKVLGT